VYLQTANNTFVNDTFTSGRTRRERMNGFIATRKDKPLIVRGAKYATPLKIKVTAKERIM
jgi:hypothetical protein